MSFRIISILIFLLWSLSVNACVFQEAVNAQITYKSPCVTDICIVTYLRDNNKYCLATIEINGEKDWAYIYGKKCNELEKDKTYNIKTKPNRCYKNYMPRRVYTSDFKVSKSEIDKARSDLKKYLKSKIYKRTKEINIVLTHKPLVSKNNYQCPKFVSVDTCEQLMKYQQKE